MFNQKRKIKGGVALKGSNIGREEWKKYKPLYVTHTT